MTKSGKPIMYMAEPPPGRSSGLDLGLRLQHRPALVHAGLEIDVVGAAQLAGILVLDVGRTLERIGRAAHSTPRRRGFSLRNGHRANLQRCRRAKSVPANSE